MTGAALLAGLAVSAAVAPLAEAVRMPVTDAARIRAARRGNGQAVPCRDGVTWRRLDIGPRDAPLVLLVHGLTTPSPVFDAVAVRLAGAGWRVVSYDLFGRGLSDTVRGPYDMALYHRQIDDMLAHLAAPGPVVLVGYSMGGAVATAYTAARPERVRQLCLLAPGGMGHRLGVVSEVSRAVPGLGDWVARVLTPISLRRGGRQVAWARSDVPGIGAIMVAETTRRGYAPAVLSSLRNVLHGDQSAAHRAVSAAGVPTLAVWGTADTVIPLAAADRLHAAHPEAVRVEIDGATHGLPFTHSTQVAQAMLERFGPPTDP